MVNLLMAREGRGSHNDSHGAELQFLLRTAAPILTLNTDGRKQPDVEHQRIGTHPNQLAPAVPQSDVQPWRTSQRAAP